MNTTQLSISKSESLTLEITPTWKWEGDEFIVGISTSILSEEGDHIHSQSFIPVDLAL